MSLLALALLACEPNPSRITFARPEVNGAINIAPLFVTIEGVKKEIGYTEEIGFVVAPGIHAVTVE